MILRLDRLLIDLPKPKNPDANGAAAVQELLGGKYGEMSTLMNYTFQSFNMRGRTQLRPFYDLIANIAAEEYGHIELVSYSINLMLTGAAKRDPDPTSTPLSGLKDARNSYHWVAGGLSSLPCDSMGNWWNGSYVNNTGNLMQDLLFNFNLECGARANKIRAYESTTDPTARAMIGYLLVRGGVHIVAYSKALEKLTGVDVGKLLPIPDISNKKFPEAKTHEDKGVHLKLYRFSPEDYKQAGLIWTGKHPEDGQEVTFEHLPADFGAPAPDLDPEPGIGGPLDPDHMKEVLKRMKG
ncbi:MAG: manganese catalase family protein [Fimbriiglobus sp.]|jgi:Mn-containing catalase|nr:manganese catalase family protein [Fimbriiglobus sp.]